MKLFAPSFIICLAGLIHLALLTSAQAAGPKEDMSARQIIEALNPVETAPRTRSLRNLRIENAQDVTPPNAGGATEQAGGNAVATSPPPSIDFKIHFDLGSSQLQARSIPLLKELATALNSEQLRSLSFAIEGHTDKRGSVQFNKTLSEARARIVKEFLVRQGVNGERLEALGLGFEQLFNQADPMAAENRRVRVSLVNSALASRP
jgi:outer membrane protein OmpA-like peptidoglycan-associated protein